jgi:hypothetical protein
MTITNTDKTYYEHTNRRLSNISQLRLFNILLDNDGYTNFMNIFRSFSINDDVTYKVNYYILYNVGYDEWWDNISYKQYGTPNLWWIIAMINSVVNPFEELQEGTSIKILKEEFLYVVLRDLENISDL